MRRWRLYALSLALVVGLLAAPWGAAAHPATPAVHALLPQDGTGIVLVGLDGPVTVSYDEWGVPNIYATTPHDLIMAQGYIHAANRWWQMEWFRHQGLGRLSEIGGSALVKTDVFLRTLGLARNAQNDLDNLDEATLALLQAYADGVNAWLGDRAPEDVAMEYGVLNQLRAAAGADPITTIEPWEPLHSAVWLQVMALGLNGNMEEELLRMKIAAQAGADAFPLLVPPYDYEHMPIITAPGRSVPVAEMSALPRMPEASFSLAALPGLENVAMMKAAGVGSNNWVVSGERTETGMPMLANDPHLGIQMPSIWFEIGLHCVEVSEACPYDVSGFSFASTPFVIIGHGADVAWGLTNVGTDVQDLYLLELNEENPLQYRYDGAWRDMQVITETITPWDGEPVDLPVRLTHFGPVVNELFGVEQPMALRWGAAEPNRNFRTFEMLARAHNWDDFQEAVSYFDLAAQNFVYADTAGNIGYIMSGRVPIRVEGHDGSMPVDGTTSAYEWQGFVDPMENPRLFNPETGYIVTANNAVVTPEMFPYTVTVDWAFGYRARRVEELLTATDVHTLESMAAIQFDNYNQAAARAVPWLQAMAFEDTELAGAVDWLATWDFQNDAESAQAALFNAFWDRFIPLVFDEVPVYRESFNLHRLETMWDNPQHPVWANAELGISDPSELAARALGEALDWMEENYGADREAWQWGQMHIARFRAAPIGQLPEGLDPRLDEMLPFLNAIFNRETPTSGGDTIVNATSWKIGSGDFEVFWLPSMRMVLDLSNWDNSLMIHTTGQSGDPQSTHYGDMVKLWAAGDYHPHRFSIDAIADAAVETFTLKPAE